MDFVCFSLALISVFPVDSASAVADFKVLLALARVFLVVFLAVSALSTLFCALPRPGLSTLICFCIAAIAEPPREIVSETELKDSILVFNLSIFFSAFSVGIFTIVSYNSRSLLFSSCTVSLQSCAEL